MTKLKEYAAEVRAIVADFEKVGPTRESEQTPETLQRAKDVALMNHTMLQAYEMVPWDHPVGRVFWIHLDRVQANDYNPNSVATHEMTLLHTSIESDGYTQPVVAIWDPIAGTDKKGRFVIVDGFHRFTTMGRFPDIYDTTGGYLPVVVLEKDIADRIAATVRHNRARGKHSVAGMSSLVFQMLKAGESDVTICKKLGLEAEELARLKHITGYSKLFANAEYSPVMITNSQLEAKVAYKKEHPDEHVPQF